VIVWVVVFFLAQTEPQRLARRLDGVQPAANAIAAIEQAAVVDIGVVAGHVQRLARHAVDGP